MFLLEKYFKFSLSILSSKWQELSDFLCLLWTEFIHLSKVSAKWKLFLFFLNSQSLLCLFVLSVFPDSPLEKQWSLKKWMTDLFLCIQVVNFTYFLIYLCMNNHSHKELLFPAQGFLFIALLHHTCRVSIS